MKGSTVLPPSLSFFSLSLLSPPVYKNFKIFFLFFFLLFGYLSSLLKLVSLKKIWGKRFSSWKMIKFLQIAFARKKVERIKSSENIKISKIISSLTCNQRTRYELWLICRRFLIQNWNTCLQLFEIAAFLCIFCQWKLGITFVDDRSILANF